MAFQMLYRDKHSSSSSSPPPPPPPTPPPPPQRVSFIWSGFWCSPSSLLYSSLLYRSLHHQKSYSRSLNNSYASFQNSINYFALLSLPHCATAPSGPGPSSISRLHDHTQTHHNRQDSSERMISPSQRPLPGNTQHSRERERETSTPAAGFEPTIPGSERA